MHTLLAKTVDGTNIAATMQARTMIGILMEPFSQVLAPGFV
jgi:hypothetical protein